MSYLLVHIQSKNRLYGHFKAKRGYKKRIYAFIPPFCDHFQKRADASVSVVMIIGPFIEAVGACALWLFQGDLAGRRPFGAAHENGHII